MHFGIIAAGEGSRLKSDGVAVPKPLINIGKETMIDRLIRIFLRNGATSLSIIINEEMMELQNYLATSNFAIPFCLVKKNTLGSFESLCNLYPTILSYPFCITTVDAIFDENEFANYIQALNNTPFSALFPVTDYIDDDSPLYIKSDLNRKICDFSDKVPDNFSKFISGGIYGFTKDISVYIRWAHQCGITKMRDFQKLLVSDGFDIQAYPMKTIFDVDRKSDWDKANHFIAMTNILKETKF